jgi:HTH-type transcriptional regulator, sugar sensing transcriptional regulator
MTHMNKEDLIEIGFNKNEAIVYISLTKFGEADANQLIKDTKFHKNIVYDNLEKLIDKGLIAYIIEEGRRVYKIASSNALIQFFEEQEKEIENKKRIAEKLSEEINQAIKKIPHRREATIYKGRMAIKSFYRETLKGNNYVVFGAPKESVEIMEDYFWKNYTQKRIANKINVRMIFNLSLRDFGKKLKNKFTQIRYFEQDFEPLTETHLQEDKVAIIVWTEEPVLFLIEDKFVAESYKRYFEDMWKKSKI